MFGAKSYYEILMVECTCDSSVTIKFHGHFSCLAIVLIKSWFMPRLNGFISPSCSTVFHELKLLQYLYFGS